MTINPNYKKPKITAGDLHTPVVFYESVPDDDFFPGESDDQELYHCTAEIYNPSMKDRDILNSVETEQAVTINIRDPRGDYVPTNKHVVEIDDYRYKNIRWNILDVRNDFANNAFITLLLGVVVDGNR